MVRLAPLSNDRRSDVASQLKNAGHNCQFPDFVGGSVVQRTKQNDQVPGHAGIWLSSTQAKDDQGDADDACCRRACDWSHVFAG